MGEAAAEENLKFVIPGITKTERSMTAGVRGITFRNGSPARESLMDKFDSDISEVHARQQPGMPLQRGVASAAVGCRDTIVNTGLAPRSRQHCRKRASETFADRVKVRILQRTLILR